ncbi:MAG TPA: methyltransferase domain-containing protein [Phycisphaerales bacterium]|nr:methyltransferase domain-containing protein [Phycisphaerales bacterium]HMP36223.1 methyltransferase domain-containing protein [Phycisphaerales bacterium]
MGDPAEGERAPLAGLSGTDYRGLRKLYARYARGYDRRFARYSAATLGEAVSALGAEAPGRLVDVACGTGMLVEAVRRRWPETPAIGVDLSAEMLEQAERRVPAGDGASGPPTQWRIGPAEALPLEEGAADTLTCTNAFHLVQRPVDALAEFRRVLVPGGRLVIVDWCADFRSMRALLAALEVVRRQRRSAWTLDDLGAAVAGAGFEIARSHRFKVGPIWGLMTIVARRA